MKKYISTLFISLFLLNFIGINAQEKISLKFTPPEKSSYTITSEILQDINMPEIGEMGKAKNIIGFTYTFEVSEKDANNNIGMAITYDKVKFITKSAMADIGYDSEKEVDSSNIASLMFAKMFSELIGKKIYVKFNEQGGVTAVEGMDEILQGIVKNSGIADMPGGDAAIAGLKQQFTNEQVKKSFDESFNVLPKEKVAIGSSWKRSTDKSVMNFNLHIDNNYTLKEVKGETAKVDIASEIKMDKSQQGLSMSGSQSGSMEIDTNTGLATKSTLNQKLKGNMKVGDKTTPLEISSVITTKSVKK